MWMYRRVSGVTRKARRRWNPRVGFRGGVTPREASLAGETPHEFAKWSTRAALMTLGPDDLVLCSGTLPRDTSFADRIEAAVVGGFAAISLWGRDYQRARRDGLGDAEIRSRLEDGGLAVAELDPAWWWLPGADIKIAEEDDVEEVFRYGEA